MRRAALAALVLLLMAGEALAGAEGPCARCHLGQPRMALGLALGPAASGALAWRVEPCPALALLRRRQAGLEERLDYMTAWLPEMAAEHYPLEEPGEGLTRARGIMRRAMSTPVASLEEGQRLLDLVDAALQEGVEEPLRAHERRVARLQAGGWVALGLLLAGLAWLWGWRRLQPLPAPEATPARPPEGAA